MKKERLIYLSILVLIAVALISLLRDERSIRIIEDKMYWIKKTHSGETFPVVFAGDSRIFRGISPKEFEDTYPGKTAVNLGYSSNGFSPAYMDFLEDRLDKEANHPVIVLGISAYNFTKNGSRSFHFQAELNRKKEEIKQYMSFYQLSKLFAPLQTLETFGLEKRNRYMENYPMTYHFDGWMESNWVNKDTTYSRQFYKVIFTDNQFQEDAAGMLYRKVKKWTDEDIHVVAFRTPTTKGIRILEDSLSGFKIETLKHELIENGANWIEIDPSLYETYDGNHLHSESALKFSRDLALEIRKIIESSQVDQTK